LSYTFIFRKQFYFVRAGSEIIGYNNQENNLELYSLAEVQQSSAAVFEAADDDHIGLNM
jgi:hypothetical protein